MKVYKCDICGKYEPRSVRRIRAENPEPGSSPLNKEQYYAFNLFGGDFCEECLYKIEKAISAKIYELKREQAAELKKGGAE